MKMKKMICAAFCGLAVITMAGCGELKPDQVNGVYKNDNNTYVLVYDTEVELPTKEKTMQFKIYETDNESVYNDKHYYVESHLLVDTKGNLYDVDIAGNKIMHGTIKDNTLNITKDIPFYIIKTGEYKKSSDPIPSNEELSYTHAKAQSEATKAWLEKKKAEGPKPSAFEEHFKKQGWK